MTLAGTPSQLSIAARAVMALGAVGALLVALNIDSPQSRLWLDNGQPWGFFAAATLSFTAAIVPWHRRLAIAAGSSSLGSAFWRLTTAVIEAFRDNGPGDWLRVGTWLFALSGWWIAWVFVWMVIAYAEGVRGRGGEV